MRSHKIEISAGFLLASEQNATDKMTSVGGFATARGGAIQLTEMAMRRATDTFADIDSEYKHIDPTNDEPKSKRNKTDIFGEDLADLNDKPKNESGFGFATARGSKITVKEANMMKYGNVLADIELDTATFNQNPLECKIPMAKSNELNRPYTFAMSTSNSNATHDFRNENSPLPSLTPADRQTALDDFNNWTKENDFNFDEVFDQHQSTNVCRRNQSMNDNTNASALQQSVKDSNNTCCIRTIHIPDAVKCARRKALSEKAQTECCKRPQVGQLFEQKSMHSMKLHELGTPKTYKRAELQDFGVQPSVIDVDIDTGALQFKFDM